MKGIQHLLLLAELVLLARCQQKPHIHISPTLKQIFSGDLITLSCRNSTSGSRVKWYFDGAEQTLTDTIWRIAVAAPKHSGSYQCESNGEKSDVFSIDVLDYAPSASLTIKTGQPVVRSGGSVVLQLDHDDGLEGWKCWVNRGIETNEIELRFENGSVSVVFQPRRLENPETIFWCTDDLRRSNQIMVRTSGKPVSLEMYPVPAVVGESLTLKCLAWGTDQISQTVFFKESTVILQGLNSIYNISYVTEDAVGRYKCNATFRYPGRTVGPPSKVLSDDQEVFVQAPLMKAVLSSNLAMSCSCPRCDSSSTYYWYYKKHQDQPWTHIDSKKGSILPTQSGTYACRAVWATRRSYLSNGHIYALPIMSILICVVTVLMVVGLAVVFFLIYFKKRNTTAPIYEDVAMRSRDIGDDKYEVLQVGAQREGDYDTLHPEAPERQKGEYEALKKEEMKEGDYDTLHPEAPEGQKGEYEALMKEEMKEREYDTLKMEGATGGE
ncbi:uncharacterized protein [Clinocottus analis]|uniref:uncharacterized protein isoform X2 n=1 Tax=Clinocottus analis TaxID=304258 RepID=UPI0035C08777